ncbi:MAG: sugar transferase [Ruminococcus sp.]|nr:sugar transferase [Ruminococcus sp.]
MHTDSFTTPIKESHSSQINIKKAELDQNTIQHSKQTYCFFKRIADVVCSSIGIILLSPIMLITALAIIIDDPKGGPVFSQERIGKNGKKFKMFKFRSMIVGAEDKLDTLLENNEMDGPAFKIAKDPRITRVGRFIRKTSIDELPQLFNIIKGDMSLVGPRPALQREVDQYNKYQMQRLYITPGITCYWQVQPNRNGISFDEWMDFDIKYIQERSFLVDLKIILKTFKIVFTAQGK